MKIKKGKLVHALVNGQVFDGDSLFQEHAVIIVGDKIADLIPQNQVPKGMVISCDLKGDYLAPGFIDLQVNGGGGVMFNNVPSTDGIRTIGSAHRRYGTTGFFPTLITSNFEVMGCALSAVEQALEEGISGVLGIHLEGPFLNPKRKGAHDGSKLCTIDEQGFELVTSLSKGKTLITIAPELTTAEMIKRMVSKGLIVCAGHSEANYTQSCEAVKAGVNGFTHLYNTMTPMQSREPGMVGAALEDDSTWFGIIADGHHVHPATFRNAVAAKSQGGALLVTDAMATVGIGDGTIDDDTEDKFFVLNGEVIQVKDDRLINSAGVLAGSNLDMNRAVNNAVRFASIDWFEALRMASLYPARAIGLDSELGYIRSGYRANLVSLNREHEVNSTWIDGVTD